MSTKGRRRKKLLDLREFLKERGLSLAGGKQPVAGDYAKMLKRVQGRPDTHVIETVMLRSLSQAKYSPDNVGHFGLAHEEYLHFTSPIRRYPDLLVHRAIRYQLKKQSQKKQGKKPSGRGLTAGGGFAYEHAKMLEFGEHCSATERRADEATRDAVDWLKCEYMLDKVGEDFEGVITSVTSFGIFVELKDIYVEGLVHVTALQNDYYHFDPSGHLLRGERTGKTYHLSDVVKVKVVRVDLDDRKIDFELADAVKGERKQKSKRSSKSRRGSSKRKRSKR